MFIKQSKGLQHCIDIKRDAMNFYYLTGGNTKDFKECIRMALADHVRLLKEETQLFESLKRKEAPQPVRGYEPF